MIRASKRDLHKLRAEVSKEKGSPSSWAVKLISAQQSAMKHSVTKLRLDETKRSLLECQKRLLWVTQQGVPTGIPKQPSTPIFTNVISRNLKPTQPAVHDNSAQVDETVLGEQSRASSLSGVSLPQTLSKLDFNTPVLKPGNKPPELSGFLLDEIKMESRLAEPKLIKSPSCRSSGKQREMNRTAPHLQQSQPKQQRRDTEVSLHKIWSDLENLSQIPYMREGRSEINTNPNQQSPLTF